MQNKIDVCRKVTYRSGSNVAAAMKKIIDKRCCLVTVVFGQARDLTALFLEAHAQHYTGEWIVGESVISSVDSIVQDLKKHLKTDSAVHELLQGMCVRIAPTVP